MKYTKSTPMFSARNELSIQLQVAVRKLPVDIKGNSK